MKTSYVMEATTLQDLGKKEEQADVLTVYNNECVFLADGVGGHPYGREAAEFIVEKAIAYYKVLKIKQRSWRLKSLVVQRMMRALNNTLLKQKARLGISEGMNTTFTMFFQFTYKIGIFHLGDSAVFLIRNNSVTRLTPQHRDSTTGYITQWLGDAIDLQPFSLTMVWQEADIFLVMSDGLADWLTEKDIVVGSSLASQHACEFYVKTATDYGSIDNKSIAVITCKKTTDQDIVWM